MKIKRFIIFLFPNVYVIFLATIFSISCSKDSPKSTDKIITAFIFSTANNNSILTADAIGSIGTDTIKVTLPTGTQIKSLTPTITYIGTSISPSSLITLDFTSPVIYTVTAQDGTAKKYVVTVSLLPLEATVYIGTKNGVSVCFLNAIDAQTGILKWRYQVPNSVCGSVAFSNNTLYFGDLSGDMNALDASTHLLKWKYKIAPSICSSSSPTIDNGSIYFSSDNRYLYALDEVTGTLKWKYSTGILDAFSQTSSPTIYNNIVYVGATDGNLYAVDAILGTLKWKYTSTSSPGIPSIINSGPAVVNNTVYFGDAYGNFSALDASTGSRKWLYQTIGSNISSSPTIISNVVYFSSNTSINAVDTNTGLWKWSFYNLTNCNASPIFANGLIYIGDGGPNTEPFYAIDALTGKVKWTFTASPDAFSSAVIFNNSVYVNNITTLYILDATTGKLNAKFSPSDQSETFNNNINSSPLIVDSQNRAYYSAISGSVN